MERKELIKDLLLDTEIGVNIILDSKLASLIALELMEDGIEFEETYLEEILELVRDNDILSLAKNIYEDGTEEYFIQEVINEYGETYGDDSDFVYIDEEFIDEVNLNKLSGKVFTLDEILEEDLDNEELKECNHCSCEGCASSCCYDDTEDEEYNEINEFLDNMLQKYYNDEINMSELIKRIYEVAYDDGFNSALLSVQKSFNSAIDEALEN